MRYRLRYIGDGIRPGYPAKHLTAARVEALGGVRVLKATGLYEDWQKPKKATEPQETAAEDKE